MRRVKSQQSTASLAAGHNGGVEALAKAGGQVIDLMGAVDLDGLAGGVENDFAVLAVAQMGLEFGARLGGYGVVDQVVEKGEKLFAGHFSLPVSLLPFFLRK